jgi:hypothetical protein
MVERIFFWPWTICPSRRRLLRRAVQPFFFLSASSTGKGEGSNEIDGWGVGSADAAVARQGRGAEDAGGLGVGSAGAAVAREGRGAEDVEGPGVPSEYCASSLLNAL